MNPFDNPKYSAVPRVVYYPERFGDRVVLEWNGPDGKLQRFDMTHELEQE